MAPPSIQLPMAAHTKPTSDLSDMEMSTTLPVSKVSVEIVQPRPLTTRRATAPTPSTSISMQQPDLSGPLPYRTRNHSPFARGHLRSYSASPLGAPPMTRAHSSPGLDTTIRTYGSLLNRRPCSPLGPPVRRASPYRRSMEESQSSYGALGIRETISEHHELETPSRGNSDNEAMTSPMFPNSQAFPRTRRRPSSPLIQSMPSPVFSSTNSSPLLAPTKFNESYPSAFPFSTSSSMPSTPTSLRSRSPSISSLETIPDTSDAEEAAAALEAERIARLKAAADAEATRLHDSDDIKRRSSSDMLNGNRERGRNMTLGSYGNRDKRKRWSVCGAERRQDLDLETIWED
ncbi:MAG: hypothetical protein M1834_002195 [Cirrosporium novae-zelandiae]|nr:MAG: hypothetical protein M1834_002195 [Cirrosporium novae-zelandiae]